MAGKIPFHLLEGDQLKHLHAIQMRQLEMESRNAEGMANYFQIHRERFDFDLRLPKLGHVHHVQRGGSPISFDRLLGTLFGTAACQQLLRDEHGVLVGIRNGEIATTPLADVAASPQASRFTSAGAC